ncbi:exodeoxyribonuclease VII large subunit [Eubacterium sp. 1001713B170207_170306_E7]|uniref:exodeoxyribonuclease VII large subunit n=1 Tax=Eubacterium sp. 1001713B170207_170306_E7 TaxID=2787097 RepID=UPI00189B4623|nr:exodeoxyribonuclease VII large subunit [Eubacterium sp. 1001713B170207_170306_E7]
MITRALSVTEVNHFIKTMLDGNSVLKNLMVEGEISNLKFHSSGHVYFSLKDSQSRIACVMFRNHVQNLKFRPEEGMKITIKGGISVFERNGQYQIYVRSMEPQGVGALYKAFEQLKAKYEALGWLDASQKKPLPEYIHRVGIVTSPTGAAVRDMISVIRRRNPQIHIVIYPTLVQGDGAAEGIARGIETFNHLGSVDVIIIGRGGGSMEDLWAFNEEMVGEAVHASQISIISAVGHETDFTIADFVADLRAPTPSVAGELVAENLLEWAGALTQLESRLLRAMNRHIESSRASLAQAAARLLRSGPESQVADTRLYLDALQDRLQRSMRLEIERQRGKLESAALRLDALNPANVLKRGYVLAEDKDGRLVRSASGAEAAGTMRLKFHDGEVIVSVIKEEPEWQPKS